MSTKTKEVRGSDLNHLYGKVMREMKGIEQNKGTDMKRSNIISRLQPHLSLISQIMSYVFKSARHFI